MPLPRLGIGLAAGCRRHGLEVAGARVGNFMGFVGCRWSVNMLASPHATLCFFFFSVWVVLGSWG